MLNVIGSQMIIRRNFGQNFYSIFNPENGFFARIEDEGAAEPFWDHSGPELLDISLTDYCGYECSFCYKYTKNTTHLSLDNIISLLDQARDIGVFQVAYGGGNPNSHPDFLSILRETRARNIVPNYTTNGSDLSDAILEASALYCGAVGLSFYNNETFFIALKKISDFGIKVNVHVLVTSHNIDYLTANILSFPDSLKNANAIIFLKYKPVGLQAQTNLAHFPALDNFFAAVCRASRHIKIGFDSCFVDAVNSYMNIGSTFVEPCEAARFSCYVSERFKLYPCSFMENLVEGISMDEMSLADAWRNGPLFIKWRSTISSARCSDCVKFDNCYGGCQLFPGAKACAYI